LQEKSDFSSTQLVTVLAFAESHRPGMKTSKRRNFPVKIVGKLTRFVFHWPCKKKINFSFKISEKCININNQKERTLVSV
jgi:hypothetical protein